LIISAPAQAVTIYDYQSNNFTSTWLTCSFSPCSSPPNQWDTSDSLVATITFSTTPSAGATLDWASGDLSAFSISAGTAPGNTWTITPQTVNVNISQLSFTFNNALNIVNWNISVSDPNTAGAPGWNSLVLGSLPTFDGATLNCFGSLCPVQAGVSNNPGVWALVPEPSTAVLLASGLALLGVRRRDG
jgi:hypothetical protein